MLTGRARIIAKMHNWERIWKAWLPERPAMTPIVEINGDAGGSWQSGFDTQFVHREEFLRRTQNVKIKLLTQTMFVAMNQR